MDAISLLFGIQTQLGDVKCDTSALVADMKTLKADVAKHEKEIYGNGKKGLKDIVTEIRIRVAVYSALGGLVGSTITVICLEFMMRKMLHGG